MVVEVTPDMSVYTNITMFRGIKSVRISMENMPTNILDGQYQLIQTVLFWQSVKEIRAKMVWLLYIIGTKLPDYGILIIGSTHIKSMTCLDVR